MTEERRGLIFDDEEGWLTLTELQARLSGCPTKHVMAVWDGGHRSRMLLDVLFTLNVKDKVMITVYESPYGEIVLGGLGWSERLEWEKSQTGEKGD